MNKPPTMGRYNRWKIIFHILLVLMRPLKCVAVVGIKTNDNRRWNDSFVWPVPQIEIYERMRTYNNSVSLLRTFYADDWHFDFNVSKFNNDVNVNTIAWIDIMNAAQDRFQKFLNQSIPKDIDPSTFNKYFPVNPNNAELVTLQGVRFTIQNVSDTTLYFGMDESYEIRIHDPLRHVVGNTSKNWIEIWSTNVYGAMYGLETLKQLLQFGWKTVKENGSTAPNTSVFYLRNSTFNLYICDAPAYSVRGIMIDTARHYLPVDLIIGNLLVMASNKLNVLHWHMTDSQSFPYDSKQFPELATSGAFCYPECVYNTSQIQTIITQASLLGIRVIVEIDLPGHSQAIGKSHPEFLSLCYNKGRSEPLDVTNTSVYDFVHGLYAEITLLFPDEWIHLGGDEVSLDCWKNSSAIQKWMRLHNMTREVELLQYFELDLLDRVVQTYSKRPIVWQDLFDSGLQGIPDTTILDIWKDWIMDESLYNATIANYDVVFSACWYLDHLNEDWWSFYTCNPREITNMTSNQQSHILGGHTSMWGESVDSTNFFERVWPRSSATAEVLWSGRTKNVNISFNEVQARLERFRCYMLQQFAIPVSPIAPDHCQSHGPIISKVEKYESNDALRIPLYISVQ